MQSKVLYFDSEKNETCLDICRDLHIDYMPSIDGTHYYERVQGKFEKREMTNDQMFKIDDRIFENNPIDKFRKNKRNVVFVFEGKVIRGVVHISDYNQEIVIQAIQDDILVFERNLRRLLILNGYKNEDLIGFFEIRHKDAINKDDRKYWKGQLVDALKMKKEMKLFSDFQLFYFSSLIEFANSSLSNICFNLPLPDQILEEREGKDVLTKLRNLAMHGLNPVKLIKDTELYSLKSLVNLFNQLFYFEEQSYRLISLIRNHDDFIRSVKINNAKQLEIIHDHHPKALWYFI